MALFRKRSPMEKLQKFLAELRSRAAALSAKRTAAETALGEATAARERHMLEGDLADDQTAEKLQVKVDSCTSRLAGLDAALAALQVQIADIEQKLADERAAVERAKAAEKLENDLDEIERALPDYLAAARRFADVLELVFFHYESTEMARFVSNGMAQVEIASACSIQELRGMVTAIRDGSAPIPAPKPAPGPVPVIEPPPPTQTVFMLRSANYRDETGRKRFAGQFEDAIMPVPTAQRALRHGMAVSVADPRRAQLRGSRGSDYRPLAPDVVDLDAIEEPKGAPYLGVHIADPALREANFTVIDRGPARALKVMP
jgi:hypothetical protein